MHDRKAQRGKSKSSLQWASMLFDDCSHTRHSKVEVEGVCIKHLASDKKAKSFKLLWPTHIFKGREMETPEMLHLKLHIPNACTTRALSCWSQESRTPAGSSIGVALEPSSSASQECAPEKLDWKWRTLNPNRHLGDASSSLSCLTKFLPVKP